MLLIKRRGQQPFISNGPIFLEKIAHGSYFTEKCLSLASFIGIDWGNPFKNIILNQKCDKIGNNKVLLVTMIKFTA